MDDLVKRLTAKALEGEAAVQEEMAATRVRLAEMDARLVGLLAEGDKRSAAAEQAAYRVGMIAREIANATAERETVALYLKQLVAVASGDTAAAPDASVN